MLVRDVMTSPAVTIAPDLALRRVAQLLDRHAITAVPVVDQGNRLVGLVSEADLVLDSVPPDARTGALREHAARGPWVTRAADVMTFDPVSVDPAADLAEAERLMTSRSVKSLPVVDEGVVVGVVSRRDVVHVLARGDDAIAADVAEQLHGVEADWRIAVEEGVVLAEGPDDEHAREAVRRLVTGVPGVTAVRFR